MCGIAGSIGHADDVRRTPSTIGRLIHRGPRERGERVVCLPWGAVRLGMARLPIVQREATLHVPFDFRHSTGCLLAFNGEVYNWLALRAELADGRPWQTECDAEVVARAWRAWGEKGLHALNGMFAFALVDDEAGCIVLARDRAGEKPLYYAVHDGALHFASEIKALPVPLVEGPCLDLDTLEFDVGRETPFRGVYALRPGERLIVRSLDDALSPRPETWWTLPPGPTWQRSFTEAAEEGEALLRDAILLRSNSAASVGIALSGGLDSAMVQAVARAPLAYCVRFPAEGVDDLPLALAAGRGVVPVPVEFGFKDLLAALPAVAYHLDTPATWTAVCQWFLCKRMAADGVVVALFGEGADELFGGYSRYRVLHWLDTARLDPMLSAYGPLLNHMTGHPDEVLARMLDRSQPESCPTCHAHAAALVREHRGTGDGLIDAMARVDFYTTMQALVRMADRMAAAFSIENRTPFLDVRVMEFAASLPVRFKVDDGCSKCITREIARRLGVPAAIVDEPTKKGLFVPWAAWTGGSDGSRGAWGREHFSRLMRAAWRDAYAEGSAFPSGAAVD